MLKVCNVRENFTREKTLFDVSYCRQVCLWASAAFAACSVRHRVHYIRADDRDGSHGNTPYYYRQRLQSRASSIFGAAGQPGAAAAFPYRFVFPANHPALHAAPAYTHYVHQQNAHQSEPLYSSVEDVYQPTKHQQQQQPQHQQPQRQQPQQHAFETTGRPQYEFLMGGGGGGGGSNKHHVSQPYLQLKQPKHYQSYELAPNLVSSLTPPSFTPTLPQFPSGTVSQPIMLLIPSSSNPGAPYQTLVLVPSPGAAATPPVFPNFQQQLHQAQNLVPQFLQPGFDATHPRNVPLMAAFPSGLGGGGGGAAGLGKFPGAQLFHRSHEPQQQSLLHHQHKSSSSSSSPSSSVPYQGSGSSHVSHATAQQPLEDKVSHGSGASGENSDDRVDSSAETKQKEEKLPEFGEKTIVKPSPKRIVVAP